MSYETVYPDRAAIQYFFCPNLLIPKTNKMDRSGYLVVIEKTFRRHNNSPAEA